MTDDVRRMRLERDLYLRLLELGARDEPRPFLEEALALVVEVTGAERGWIAIDDRFRADAPPRFQLARGFDEAEVAAVRRELSTGIVARAIASGQTVSTASAVDDPRFRDQASVLGQRIRAVICAPVGSPAIGVVYLQGRGAPGPFPEEHRALAEIVARHLAPLAERLLARESEPRGVADPTRELRARLAVDGLAGTSRALAEVLRQVLVAAPVPVSVLVTGESGTGKTAIARALHASSPRAAGPFVEINCAAIPEALFESELFGAEKGAHSTATRRIEGKIDAARGGTLFLDEVGEIPLAAQGKLLTFLQSKRYYRLGSATPLEADARVVAATNASLEELVRAKRFREDLYYRLAVLEVRVPPLRDRPEDVGPIAERAVHALGAEHGRPVPLARAALVALEEAEWPGNVRELENVVARGWATALSEGAPAIEPRHLFPDRATVASAAPGAEPLLGWQDATRRFQARYLREALEATGWNVAEAARRLGLARSHVNDLLKAHGLARPASRG
jgi:Nif-specific regulatory protein